MCNLLHKGLFVCGHQIHWKSWTEFSWIKTSTFLKYNCKTDVLLAMKKIVLFTKPYMYAHLPCISFATIFAFIYMYMCLSKIIFWCSCWYTYHYWIKDIFTMMCHIPKWYLMIQIFLFTLASNSATSAEYGSEDLNVSYYIFILILWLCP